MPNTPTNTIARTQATLELIGAGVLWGFGFVATIWALTAMEPLALTGWRFVVASVVSLLICLLVPGLRRELRRDQFWLAAPPGLLLSALLLFQTWGLKYTSATKSSFITTLYVLMVPLMESYWLKRRLGRIHYIAVGMALAGTMLICNLVGEILEPSTAGGRLSLNIGDLLTFFCAVIASFQIMWLGRISHRVREPFVFNAYQSIWAGSVPLVLSLFMEPLPHLDASWKGWLGFLSLAFGSTLIGFSLQIRAQRVLSPSLASLLFLLESPFATLFAFLILDETLHAYQWIGAGLILVAASVSTALATED